MSNKKNCADEFNTDLLDFVPESGEEPTENERQRLREERYRARLQERKRRRAIVMGVLVFLLLAVVVVLIIVTRKDSEKKPTGETESVSVTSDETSSVSSRETETTTAAPTETTAEKTEMTETPTESVTETETETVTETASSEESTPEETTETSSNVSADIVIPSWITQAFLTVSEKNRPGIALDGVKNIVIHWVANPGSSAMDNRNYFEDLSNPAANPEGTSASSHFIVGLYGEIIQCVPTNEVAYANYPRNNDTISIENCHPDWDGEFSSDTYWALVRLTAYLCEQYGLTKDDIIRHHDVSGKDCPKYYVEHEDAWEAFKDAVGAFMAEHPDILSEFP